MLVVILVYRGFMTLGRGRLMRCGHAMRHSELETTVRAPAMIFKGCLFFFFIVDSLFGLVVVVTIFGIVASFCQFWMTVLTKNGDFVCKKTKT